MEDNSCQWQEELQLSQNESLSFSQDLFDDSDGSVEKYHTKYDCSMNTAEFARYVLQCSTEHIKCPEASGSTSVAASHKTSKAGSDDDSVCEGDDDTIDPNYLRHLPHTKSIAADDNNTMDISDDDSVSEGDDDTIDPNYKPLDSLDQDNGKGSTSSESGEASDNSLDNAQRFFSEDDAPDTQVEDVLMDTECTHPGRKTSRKRVRNEAEWKANIRKRRRNNGSDYVTRKGAEVRRKTIDDKVCGCKKQCNRIIPFTTRQQIFSKFWKLGDWSAQNAYIVGLVKLNEIKRRDKRDRRPRSGIEGPRIQKKRNITREFNLPTSTGMSNIVCKEFFLGTFQISNGRLNRALQSAASHNGPQADQRGRKEPKNKTPNNLIEDITNFITSFPKYESHYCRENGQSVPTGKMYFAPGLKTANLYRLYVEDCVSNARQSVSEQIFRKILKKDFRISFHQPLKDTCKTCDQYKVQIPAALASQDNQKAGALKEERDRHHEKAEQVKEEIKKDKNKANTKVICFDLQKTLPTPVLTTNVVYYKRQLWTYNLGIHDENDNTAHMCMWHEGQASRGPNEVGSCILKYIKENDMPENIIAYSDSCGGQNRNIKMCLFWLHVVADDTNNLQVCDQKFFVPGHSYMSCDRDFGIIEQQKPSHPYIFLPDDWIKLVERASKKFTVCKMSSNDIVHVEEIMKSIVHRKVDVNGEKVEWLKIQWLRIRKDAPFQIFFKYCLDESAPFRCLDIAKRSPRENRLSLTSMSGPLPQQYPNGHPIKTAKYNDLQSLFPFIPMVHHEFYVNLLRDGSRAADNNTDNDIVQTEDSEV